MSAARGYAALRMDFPVLGPPEAFKPVTEPTVAFPECITVDLSIHWPDSASADDIARAIARAMSIEETARRLIQTAYMKRAASRTV